MLSAKFTIVNNIKNTETSSVFRLMVYCNIIISSNIRYKINDFMRTPQWIKK